MVSTTPNPDDGDDDNDIDSRSGTPVIVVTLVMLGLILIIGAWYWRGRRRSRREGSETDQGDEIPEGRTERRENEHNGREDAEIPEARPLVVGTSVGVAAGSQSAVNTGGLHRTTEGDTHDGRGTQNENETQRNTEDSDDGEEMMQGTYYATQSEIKKSTQSIYEPE